MSGIKPLAQAMEVKIKPYPPRSGAMIGQKFGTPAGTLFEVSIKSNLLILLYQSGEDQGG